MKDIRLELLEKVSQLDGTEYGEMLVALLELEYRSDYCSDDLRIAIDKEIQLQYEYCKENVEFVEEEETITRKVVSIEYKDQ